MEQNTALITGASRPRARARPRPRLRRVDSDHRRPRFRRPRSRRAELADITESSPYPACERGASQGRSPGGARRGRPRRPRQQREHPRTKPTARVARLPARCARGGIPRQHARATRADPGRAERAEARGSNNQRDERRRHRALRGLGRIWFQQGRLEQLTNILAAENPDLRVYRVDPGDMRTRMQQEAFPGEDISDRPLPEESVRACSSF